MPPTAGSWERSAKRWLDSPGRQIVASLPIFTLVGVVSATQLHVNWTSAGFEPFYPSLLGVELVEWWIWALAVPVVVAAHGAAARSGWGWRRAAAVHLAVATAVFALQNAILVLATPLVDPSQPQGSFAGAYLSRGALRVTSAWVVYAFVLGIVWILTDTLRRQSLTRDLYDAQLRALRAQIQPHFLFNTLNVAGALIRSGDRDQSVQTLVSLSELLRRSLTHSRADEVPLEQELDFLDLYLSIQRTRFGENLRVEMEIDDEARTARVPPLMLQPLVENAIRHGLDPGREVGTVSVVARVSGDVLRIVVEDDGGRLGQSPNGRGEAGIGEGGEIGGVGLANLRDRLLRLYGPSQHALVLRGTDAGTTTVVVDLPLRR
jgi:two-component system, LytTR family, sensor kinase